MEPISTSTKKPRGEDGLGGQETGLRRDEELWYDDGTIVVVAGNVEFWVYKGVLAAHSPVFADMFSLPQPQPTFVSQESQRCPVVSVIDSPEDLRLVLKAILPNKDGRQRRKGQRSSFDEISAYARLGHKYQIDHLVSQAVDYLKDHFTDHFDKWCKRDYVPEGFRTVHAIGVVNIARLTNCDSILPIALAVCCTLDVKHLLRGFKRQDGTREKLCEDDLVRCLRAKETLMQEASAALLKAFSSLLGYVCDNPVCRPGLHKLLNDIAADAGAVADEHPFRDWDNAGYADWFEGSPVCASCKDCLRKVLQAYQVLIWIRLPEILGLKIEGWGLSAADSDSDSDTVW
ncbi:hypothetical protein OH76DRAFT_1351508 [Lentinus brumalis]|uniref:BTB domain-containing protein n=1 Tax=Lentinus brumalis TaxID=2498619 RepID=A0A371D933_9APHY|nr:hypothetical protein OH76DRAFT_1351508 [Polyporus brumalis]